MSQCLLVRRRDCYVSCSDESKYDVIETTIELSQRLCWGYGQD